MSDVEQGAIASDTLVVRGKILPKTLPADDHHLADPNGHFARGYSKLVKERDEAREVIELWRGSLSRHHRTLWHVDREFEAIKIAQNLNKKADIVVTKLRTTMHGCRYLIAQWIFVRSYLQDPDFDGDLPPEAHNLAAALAGVPIEYRDHQPSYEPNPFVSIDAKRQHIGEYIDNKLADLRILLEAHTIEDHDKRELAIAMPESFPDETLKRCARCIAKCERDLTVMWKHFKKEVVKPTEPKPVKAKAKKTVSPPVEERKVQVDFPGVQDEKTVSPTLPDPVLLAAGSEVRRL